MQYKISIKALRILVRYLVAVKLIYKTCYCKKCGFKWKPDSLSEALARDLNGH